MPGELAAYEIRFGYHKNAQFWHNSAPVKLKGKESLPTLPGAECD